MRSGTVRIMILLLISTLLVSCAQGGKSDEPVSHTYSTDTEYTDEHEEITWELIQMADHNPQLRALLEKSVDMAYRMNSDPDTNPVSDLESYYDFIDHCYKGLPWQIHTEGKYSSLYDQIDQGMGCLYFVCSQPLEELEGRGYYHNSLMYHEPFRSWFIRFLSGSGMFLSSGDSWCEEYYQTALANPDFHLDDDTYESPDHWKSFNDFFARKLKDPSVRPVADAEDDRIVIFPADSVPQGVWDIDVNSIIITEDPEEQGGIVIKTGRLNDVSVLLEGSRYARTFANGRMTHTFLDINDYHRYHVPVSGTVREVLLIRQDDAPGGVITWDSDAGRYVEYYSDTFGWQSIETRGAVIIETESGGYAAVIPVGMCQVASVNFEEPIVPGAKVKKGDPLGFFLFGGSDIVLLFSEDLDFRITADTGTHGNMGQEYGRFETD